MWIQIRTFDGKKTVKVDSLSKLTKLEELRERLVDEFDVAPERQWLFYRGKQMVDGHTLYDYDVRQNDLIQIMIRPERKQEEEEEEDEEKENEKPKEEEEVDVEQKKEDAMDEDTDIEVDEKGDGKAKELEVKSEDKRDLDMDALMKEDFPEDATYKPGDYVDARDPRLGCWFEGIVLRVSKKKSDSNENEEKSEESYFYEVKYESENENDDERVTITLASIRPRSVTTIAFPSIEIQQKVLVNFNLDDRKKRGYWYDAIVERKQARRKQQDLFCTVLMGENLAPVEDCQIQFVHEIFQIEAAESGKRINFKDIKDGKIEKPKLRKNQPECDACQDNPNIQCKQCWCAVCGGKDRPEMQIMCDECDLAYHITCLTPPLEKIPDDEDWYCPSCKNESDIVKKGQKLKENKKKSKMVSATSKSNRDWGRGMACVGRTKVCTLVPTNHFGSVPGVEVGQLWKYRVQVSEAGVHRPHVAGIAGRESEGAFSIVLSGGYEDDNDDGDEFFYTGSGGRDLSGNKRTAEQSCDQVLTRMNMALAKNCDAKVNAKDGAEATDWRKGKPVRVIRNCKAAKHSEYAPEEGNRYDGIYKLVKYWPEKGKSGFIVWRYLFRRDDPIPAPWTEEGKKRAEELGLKMVYPDGYLDKVEKQKQEKESGESPPKKKQKTEKNGLDEKVEKLIEKDEQNEKLWARAKTVFNDEGRQKFIDFLQEEFMCICCQEVVCKPVTTKCFHNICKQCLQMSFKAEVYSCPMCRADLGEKNELKVNESLDEILLTLFPGYQVGR